MDQRAGVAAHAGLAKHAGGRGHGALGCTGGAASRGDTGLGVLTLRVLKGNSHQFGRHLGNPGLDEGDAPVPDTKKLSPGSVGLSAGLSLLALLFYALQIATLADLAGSDPAGNAYAQDYGAIEII